MGIEDYVTLISRILLYSAVVFTLNPLLQFYRQLFLFTLLTLYTYFLCRQKVSKSSAHGRFLNAKRS